MTNISTRVREIMDSAENDYLNITQKDGTPLKFNQRKTKNRIDCYLNDQYLESDDENRLFWNIIKSRIIHFAKLLGTDTKDFMPYGEGEYNFLQAWALRKKLKEWFGEVAFYEKLNDIAEGLATYGSIVWKRYKDDDVIELEEVNLDNLYFDQGVKCIDDTDVVEMHHLTLKEVWEKDSVWDNVKELADKAKKGKVDVWEYWGWFSADGEKPEYKHVIGYGFGDQYLKLFEETVTEKDFPYYDFHLGRYMGRWMRVGVPERLFKLQAKANKLVNQNDQASDIASLLLLQTSNGDVTGNVLEQAVNGQIINDPELKQIGITNTGLQNFIAELQQIEAQADKLCLTPDIIQGENSPSAAPFRSIAVMNSAAMSAFTAYKQNLGEKIADILMKDILPNIVTKWNKGLLIELAEDDEDVDMYDEAALQEMKKQYLLEGYGQVTPEIEQMLRDKIDNNIKKIGRKVEMEKGWIDFKYGIKMMPTSETVDKTAKNDAYFNALQMIGANPMLINIPLFKQYLEDNGISWWKLTPKQVMAIQQGATGANMPEPKQPDQLLAQAQPMK